MNSINDIITTLLTEFWSIFSIFNGNPAFGEFSNNYGIRFTIGMFFCTFLFIVIKMRALSTMKHSHIVAMIGSVLIFIRYFVMLILEWGYQIGLYDDPIVHFLYPPLEHFFYMLGLSCFAYYSLHHFNYYPGLLKQYTKYIPIFLTSFFIYTSVMWKNFFIFNNSFIQKYKECMIDWQSHLIITIIASYVLFVSIFKYKKYNSYITTFWLITLCEHFARTVCFYNNYEPSWLATIFHALQIWVLPILTLHFVKAYVVKLNYCELCRRHVHVISNI